MLTFLRRIRKSLINSLPSPQQRNATGKPVSSTGRPFRPLGRYFLYAIGEILLVMIGILLALQVNNWNEWRKDRIMEKEILNDLKLNLENNRSIIQGRIAYLSRGENSSRVILNVIDELIPFNDSLGIHFSQATRGYGGADVISHVAYETLKNSGFNIITNKPLRDEILKLFETTYRALISFDETFKLQNTYHKEVVGNLLYNDKEYILKPFDFEEIRKSRKYYSSVSDHHHNYQWMKKETIDGLSETERILQLIKNELSKSNNDIN